MDPKTIATYDARADEFISDWMTLTPAMIRELIQKYFSPKSRVVDVGAGSGRDVAWMCEIGFMAEGVDASEGLLQAARKKYPGLIFRLDVLPKLSNTTSNTYDHALCSAVLMHLPQQEIGLGVHNIVRIVKPGGRIICSIRPSRAESDREEDGRLFSDICLNDLSKLFISADCTVLESMNTKADESDRHWHTLVVQKN